MLKFKEILSIMLLGSVLVSPAVISASLDGAPKAAGSEQTSSKSLHLFNFIKGEKVSIADPMLMDKDVAIEFVPPISHYHQIFLSDIDKGSLPIIAIMTSYKAYKADVESGDVKKYIDEDIDSAVKY